VNFISKAFKHIMSKESLSIPYSLTMSNIFINWILFPLALILITSLFFYYYFLYFYYYYDVSQQVLLLTQLCIQVLSNIHHLLIIELLYIISYCQQFLYVFQQFIIIIFFQVPNNPLLLDDFSHTVDFSIILMFGIIPHNKLSQIYKWVESRLNLFIDIFWLLIIFHLLS
jgi:hypothetical protein